jgi:hypothetical protein
MAQLTINVGSNANDGTGDDLRTAMQKVNTNFTELYTASPLTSSISIEGNEISSNVSNANLKLTAAGTGAIEFEGIQIRDNHIEAIRSNDNLVLSASGTGDIILGSLRIHGSTITSDDSTAININESLIVDGSLSAGSFSVTSLSVNNLSSADSSAIQINDGVNISGTLSANLIDTNTIFSSDSSAISISEGLNVSGILSANTIDTNTISSSDSSAVTVSDNLQVNGTLTATSITGVNILTHGAVTDGTTNTSASTITNLDTFASATYRSAKYEVSISDSTNSRYALHTIHVTHDGTNAYIVDTVVSSTGSSMATFTADISAGDVRVRIVPISSDSTTYKFIRTAINV